MGDFDPATARNEAISMAMKDTGVVADKDSHLRYEYLGMEVTIYNASQTKTLLYQDANAGFGKFWEGNKSNEIYWNTISQKTIGPGSYGTLRACGRSDAASGTSGYVVIKLDGSGNRQVGRYEWNVPYIGKTSFSAWTLWDKFTVVSSWSDDPGANEVKTTVTITPTDESVVG